MRIDIKVIRQIQNYVFRISTVVVLLLLSISAIFRHDLEAYVAYFISASVLSIFAARGVWSGFFAKDKDIEKNVP